VQGADVVVVGGGIIGCACARELAERGLRVTLIERDSLAAGASGRNHGLLIMPTDPTLAPMARLAMQFYLERAGDLPLPLHVDPEPIGMLIVGGDDLERDQARAEAEAVRACGIEVDRLDAAALAGEEPALARDLDEGWLLHDGRLVDPAALTVALALAARDAGAQILRHLPVRTLVATADRVRGVVTDEGRIDADEVVVAAGPWVGQLLRPLSVNLPVTPARGFLVHMAPEAGLVRHVIEGAGWHALPGEERMPPVFAQEVASGAARPVLGSVIQQNADGTMLAGSSRQAAYGSEPEDPAIPREILRRTIRLVPAAEKARVLGSWWGIRPMTSDGLPIVGRLGDGLVVATGHGSVGVTLAAGTAPLVAATITREDPPIDPGPFLPERFD
jgi:glycine/D-amino acid oxidase-like deaminating enzyme